MKEKMISREALLLTAERDLDAAVEIPIKEELVKEAMQKLNREIHAEAAPTSAATASFLGDGAESCGPAVSDSTSSVMVGLYGPGCIGGDPMVVGDIATDHGDRDEKGNIGEGMEIDGYYGEAEGPDYDDDDDDEEWLQRVLSEIDSISGFFD